ncbi:hypothetical protein D3C71_2227290 [compost metagenome]
MLRILIANQLTDLLQPFDASAEQLLCLANTVPGNIIGEGRTGLAFEHARQIAKTNMMVASKLL